MMLITAIKDIKTGTFGSTFSVLNKDVALRDAETLANDTKDHLISKYPQDFELYSLGEYDERNGTIISKVEFIVNLKDLCHKLKE